MESPIPVLRPLLPDTEALVPYLRRIDDGRWYTNGGPLVREFEQRLAEHFDAEPADVVTSSNATLAIAQCLRALGAPPGSLCVMPSWTFVATAAAATWAGLTPYFIDVCPQSWVLRPQDVAELATRETIGAVVLVSAFGARLDLPAWEEFSARTGIPVVIDAAAGFDSFATPQARSDRIPTVVSLHATKVFGVGEGAAVVLRDVELAKRIRAFGNFGFSGSRHATLPGINAKMNEYAAAIGLAQFDLWPERRREWEALTATFVREVARIPGLILSPGFGEGWVSSFGVVECREPDAAARLTARLDEGRVETRQWWGAGCHRQDAYRDCPRTALPNTDSLARRVVGLPFWLGLGSDAAVAVFDMVADVLAGPAAPPRPDDAPGRPLQPGDADRARLVLHGT